MSIRETLADYAHEAWSGWMRYLFEKSNETPSGVTIPRSLVERWKRQLSTPYADLPEEEKDSDRIEADKILALVPKPHVSWNDASRRTLFEEFAWLGAINKAQEEQFRALEKVSMTNEHEIEQILGKALGYPRYCDDQENFPGSTEADGVCVGEHVAVSLAMEAAQKIKELEEAVKK